MAEWYGVGGDWKLSELQPEPPIQEALAKWTQLLPFLKQWGFNTTRLSFRFPATPVGCCTIINYAEIEQVISLLASNGISVILDLHNWRDMTGFFGSTDWMNSWLELAYHFKGDTRVLAYELFNEPNTQTWHSSVDGGGCGVGYGEGVLTSLLQCIDAIRATGDNHTIVLPDPWYWRPTEDDVWNPWKIPAEMKRPNTIVTGHETSMKDGALTSVEEALDWWNNYRKPQILIWVNQGWTVWIGEMSIQDISWDIQKAYLTAIINTCVDKKIGFNLWLPGAKIEEWNEILSASKYTPTPISPLGWILPIGLPIGVGLGFIYLWG